MTVNTVDRYGMPMGGTTAQRASIPSGALYDGYQYFDTDLQKMLVYSATNSSWQTMGGDTATADSAYGIHAMKWAKVVYDFAVDGGAVSTITPASTVTLPVGAIIYGGLLEVLTAATSGGSATVAVQAQAANDIINAAAYGGAPWSTTGIKAIIPVMTAATAVQIATTAKQIKVVVGTAALTALKFNLHLAYFLGG